MSTSKLKINIFGESFKLKHISLSDDQKRDFEIIGSNLKLPLCKALIDPYFYFLLKDKKFQSIDDLEGTTWEGLLNTPKNHIEIWFKNKKIQKLKFDDLIENQLLFPLYRTFFEGTFQQKSGIYIEQKAIGLVNSLEIKSDDFNIDDLEFQLLEINESLILENLKYNNQLLISKKKDTLITFQNGYTI